MTEPTMSGKTVVITGANSGIGKATAVALAAMGARVMMVCRSRERGEAALADVRRSGGETAGLLTADLSSQEDVRRVAGEILAATGRIDVLLNNAGALQTSYSVTVDGIERTWATNHLNYFLLTHLLRDRLLDSAPARIINVSSRAHVGQRIDLDDPQQQHRGYRGYRAYGQSKLANVLFTNELARRLEGTGVTANSLHPGVVRTGFGKTNTSITGRMFGAVMRGLAPFLLSPDRGAATSIYLASSPKVEGMTGRYFVNCAPASPHAAALDEEAARRLWEISERMTGIASAEAEPTAR